jgi:hypothetical protein
VTGCLALGLVIVGLSWLVGGLDALAVGAVIAVWSLCVATRLILGRPGVDWTVPTPDRMLAATERLHRGRPRRGGSRGRVTGARSDAQAHATQPDRAVGVGAVPDTDAARSGTRRTG